MTCHSLYTHQRQGRVGSSSGRKVRARVAGCGAVARLWRCGEGESYEEGRPNPSLYTVLLQMGTVNFQQDNIIKKEPSRRGRFDHYNERDKR